MGAGFEQIGDDRPRSPVIVSVPHAGRDYPARMLAALRVPLATITGLEDRHVDAVARGARSAETMLIQRLPRAWIDLNRSEDERDPRVDTGARAAPGRSTEKIRGGLGLVPARTGGHAMIWRMPFTGADVDARIRDDHRPYHDRLAALLEAARARFGTAVLLDLHSMPPLGAGRPRVVIGDRFGTTAAARFVRRVEAEVARHGVSINAPYAGGHLVQRHGDPANGVHAVQLELDRSLYLDARFDRPGHGAAAMAALVRRVLGALADEVGDAPLAQAAE